MNKLFSLMLAFLFCFTAAGCDEDSTTTTTQTQPEPEKQVVFDLPEGWEWSGGNVIPTGSAIYWYDREKPKGFYKIGDFSFQEGDEATLEAKIMGYQAQHEECQELPCSWSNEYVDYIDESTLEVKTIGNEKLYVVANHTKQEDYEFWGHGINFEKDSIVYSGAIYGAPFDNFESELKTILDSIRVE